jgi:hypothetical protein
VIAVTGKRPEQTIQRAVFWHLEIRGVRDCFIPDIVVVRGGLFFGLEAGAMVSVAYGLDDALARLESWGLLRGGQA